MFVGQREQHCTEPIDWLRATVLDPNHGIVFTASLLIRVSAADATQSNVWVAGVAGLVAGTMSMAAGEYRSVHSPTDTEQTALALGHTELLLDLSGEHAVGALFGATS